MSKSECIEWLKSNKFNKRVSDASNVHYETYLKNPTATMLKGIVNKLNSFEHTNDWSFAYQSVHFIFSKRDARIKKNITRSIYSTEYSFSNSEWRASGRDPIEEMCEDWMEGKRCGTYRDNVKVLVYFY